MKRKKLLSSLLAASLCLALCAPMTAQADGQKVVTLGADLSEDQKAAVLKYFGVYGQNIETLTITNADERAHLGSYVPLEQIGTRTFSCALVCPTNGGGIQVKTANLSWVTSNMIATTLSTAGVVNCDVLAASPFEVSGTGALTGVIMAYETASGTTLDPVRKDLATQEMITTTQIANQVGQSQATNIVNEIKIQVIEGAVVEPEAVEEIVEEVVEDAEAENPEFMLSDEDRALLTGLMTQIAEQEYDYEEVKDTLQRVEENVGGMQDALDELQQVITQEPEEETEPETLSPDSILMNTDDSALGGDTLFDATNVEAVPEETERDTEASDDFFEITTSDNYTDGVTGDFNIDEEFTLNEEGTADDFFVNETEDFYQEENWEEEPVFDGTGMDDGMAETLEPSSEALEEYLGLELTECDITPDSDDGSVEAAGIYQIKLVYGNADLVPVSGALTIWDSEGNVCAAVDLTDKEQIRTAPLSEEGKAYYGWTEGTQLIINLGQNLLPSKNYRAVLDGVLAQTADPMVLEGIPTAAVSEEWTLQTDSYGADLNVGKVTDLSVGMTVTGKVILDETMAYASISSYDTEKLAFDLADFDLEMTDFQMTCLASGNASFTIDYYDAEGNYLASAEVTATIQ